MGQSPFNFIDLFCGAGGFTEGILLSGGAERSFRLVLANDIHEDAEKTHLNRFRNQIGLDYVFLRKDIQEPDFVSRVVDSIPSEVQKQGIDLVVGGPPCQGFSVFGARNHDDHRNNLFERYLAVIKETKPKYFVMENVPGLALMYKGVTVKKIFETVSKMKSPSYKLSGPIKVNASLFGVPQVRERILFIGSRSDVPQIHNLLPSTQPVVSVSDAIGDLSSLRPWEESKSYDTKIRPEGKFQIDSRRGRLFRLLNIPAPEQLHNHSAAKHTPDVIARFAMIEPGGSFDCIPRLLWDTHLKSAKRWCVRLDAGKPSYTVTTLPDDLIHYKQHRILTAREWARLQSFDDTFIFLGPRSSGGGGKGNKKRNKELPQYSQIGNAVPPLLAEAIGRTIISALGGKHQTGEGNDILPAIRREISC